MTWKNLKPQKRLRIIGGIILLVGLISAIAVYLVAEQSAASAVGYDFIDGQAYGISPGSSKRYVHDLEVYGGKAAVLADDFNRWFSGLWQGTSLAYTIAFLSTVTALGFFFVAGRIEEHEADGGERTVQGERDEQQ
jgi:hypothetical protein